MNGKIHAHDIHACMPGISVSIVTLERLTKLNQPHNN